MLELPMAAASSGDEPPILLQHLQHLTDFHPANVPPGCGAGNGEGA